MEKEDIPSNMITKTRRFKLKVPQQGKEILQKWKGLYNFAYNKSVWYFNESTEYMDKNSLINCIKSNHNWINDQFMLELPTELREGAAKELSKNAKAAISNLRNKNITHFEMKFKKKSNKFNLTNIQQRSIKFKDESRKTFQILSTHLPVIFKSYRKLPEIKNDFSLYYDGKDYFLLLPYEVEKEVRNTGKVVSLDPGIRTFQTSYSNNGSSTEYCTSDSVARLYSLAITVDKLISKRSKSTNYKRKWLSNQICVLRKKIKNLQDEMHKKVINELTRDNDIILLPSFETSSMTKKFKRKLKTKTVRNLSLLAHSLFKEKLKTKTFERGCRILICEEHYTSKTCSMCGKLNYKLGSSKTFKCSGGCNVIIDRDVNAARNIMLRAMRGSAISDIEINETLQFKNVLKNHLEHYLKTNDLLFV